MFYWTRKRLLFVVSLLALGVITLVGLSEGLVDASQQIFWIVAALAVAVSSYKLYSEENAIELGSMEEEPEFQLDIFSQQLEAGFVPEDAIPVIAFSKGTEALTVGVNNAKVSIFHESDDKVITGWIPDAKAVLIQVDSTVKKNVRKRFDLSEKVPKGYALVTWVGEKRYTTSPVEGSKRIGYDSYLGVHFAKVKFT